jgi:UDP-glucose 4-epimerase
MAHLHALQYLLRTQTSYRFNLGSGKGYTVLEIIEAARRVTGHPIPAEFKDRFVYFFCLLCMCVCLCVCELDYIVF